MVCNGFTSFTETWRGTPWWTPLFIYIRKKKVPWWWSKWLAIAKLRICIVFNYCRPYRQEFEAIYQQSYWTVYFTSHKVAITLSWRPWFGEEAGWSGRGCWNFHIVYMDALVYGVCFWKLPIFLHSVLTISFCICGIILILFYSVYKVDIFFSQKRVYIPIILWG